MKTQTQKVIIAITKSNFGGAQKYVYTLAKTLQNKGFLVKVLLGGDGVLISKLNEANIEIIKLESLQRDISIFKEFKVFFEILKILKKEKPDVFHVNSSKIGGIGSFVGRLIGIKKIIFTVHGFAFNENRNFLVKIFLKFFYWLTFLLSHKSVYVSQKTKEQAPRFLLSKSKFEIIYNGIENIDFIEKETAKEILGKMNINLLTNKIWIGTIAELHPIKGIDLLIESANEILKKRNDVQFVVWGDGELREKLEVRISFFAEATQDKQKLGSKKNFILFGYLKDASKYLKALDMFVLPSRSEAMPFAILEAMQAQIPIIASNVGGIPEMLPQDFLFERENVNQLTRKIEEKLNSKNKIKYNLEKFSLEQMIEKTIRIYN